MNFLLQKKDFHIEKLMVRNYSLNALGLRQVSKTAERPA